MPSKSSTSSASLVSSDDDSDGVEGDVGHYGNGGDGGGKQDDSGDGGCFGDGDLFDKLSTSPSFLISPLSSSFSLAAISTSLITFTSLLPNAIVVSMKPKLSFKSYFFFMSLICEFLLLIIFLRNNVNKANHFDLILHNDFNFSIYTNVFNQVYFKHQNNFSTDCIIKNQMARIYDERGKNTLPIKTYESSNTYNTCNSYNFVVLLLLFFIFKMKGSKIRNLPLIYILNNLLLLSYLGSLLHSVYNYRNSLYRNLKEYPTTEFFTIESLKICNHISEFEQKKVIFSAAMAEKKLILNSRRYYLYLLYILLLSWDISTNPGPTHNQNLCQSDNIWLPFQKKGFHIMHLNINSLLSKIDEVRDIIIKTKPTIFGVSESKLDDTVSDNEIHIDGYVIIRSDRNRHGGGVACYIKEDICFNVNPILSKEIEGVLFDILLPKTRSITVGVFYRPPDQNNFLDTLESDLEKLDLSNNDVFLLGDFNINLLKNGRYIFESKNQVLEDTHSALFKKYRNFCSHFAFKQILRKATRIACNSADSLLDHILTKSIQNISQYGIIDVSLSDHQMIYLTRKINRFNFNTHKEFNFRCLKKYSADEYRQNLDTVEFPNYERFNNVDVAYRDFIKKLLNVIDNVAPWKTARIKNNTPEWFDQDIYQKIKIRRKAFKKFKKSKLHIDYDLYRKARNSVIQTIKRKKESFIKDELAENINEPKKLWKTIKSLGLPSKISSSAKICLKEKNKVIFEPKQVSEIFNKYFSSLAENLVAKLPPAPKIFNNVSTKLYYQQFDVVSENFSFSECNCEQIEKIIQSFNIAKAAGIDNLNCRFLKDGAKILSNPLKQICNLSLRLSCFPTDCKIAKLKPLFKKGSSTEPKNYRPISLLPIISKILEKVVHEQTQSYLREKKLLYNLQSGFRSQHSTNFCLSYLTDKILTGFDSGLLTGMVLIDLQKAFDTINHTFLLNKMEHMGFSKQSIKWFRSYLSERTFIVSIEKSFSSEGNLNCGVPQGSILGPLLFLLYINDLKQASESLLLLYADDSCIIYQSKDVQEIENKLNKDFEQVCNWFIDNKLSIHLGEDKTKCILFSPRYKKNLVKDLDISYKETKIKQYSSVTYLGCILDEAMTGEGMAMYVIKKINSKLKFLYRKNSYFSQSLRRMLCNAIIQPHFDYACSGWYTNLSEKIKNKLQVTQNNCIRFCLQKPNRSHIGYKDFVSMNWLSVAGRAKQMILCNVFNFFQNKCPTFMKEVFTPVDHQSINTRSSYQKLVQPKRKTKAGLNSLSYVGPSYWNKLPATIKDPRSLNSFKHSIKKYFFEKMEIGQALLFSY